ncbi:MULTISPECIES: PE domain-containing protein [Mycolicibacterium]|uniref:PE domain-containing protein n=1 Tax=Mycolicibacterium TaxID=1866885 RepID=UPI001E622A23|nr:PE domain-containing protein [Mycolicibacterium mageritense]MCC9184353.1 PE domain-containing protein [Mycolicibacterium mageritense]
MSGLIGVDPALIAAQAAFESAGTASMGGATAAAAPIVAVLPPGADGASAALAAAANARGAATQAMMAEFMAVRQMRAGTIAVNGSSYTAVETVSQTLLSI